MLQGREEGENLPRNRSWLQELVFISKGHIRRWRQKPKTETSPGLFWREMVLSHDTTHQLNPVSSEKRSQAGFIQSLFRQGPAPGTAVTRKNLCELLQHGVLASTFSWRQLISIQRAGPLLFQKKTQSQSHVLLLQPPNGTKNRSAG